MILTYPTCYRTRPASNDHVTPRFKGGLFTCESLACSLAGTTLDLVFSRSSVVIAVLNDSLVLLLTSSDLVSLETPPSLSNEACFVEVSVH